MFVGCAFVQFTTRGAAEKAADATFNKLTICGSKVTIRSVFTPFSHSSLHPIQIIDTLDHFRWGKSHSKSSNSGAGPSSLGMEGVPGMTPAQLRAPPAEVTQPAILTDR